jgi:hypothetical protein
MVIQFQIRHLHRVGPGANSLMTIFAAGIEGSIPDWLCVAGVPVLLRHVPVAYLLSMVCKCRKYIKLAR